MNRRLSNADYDNLPLLPNLIGESVAMQPYTEAEFSPGLRCGKRIERHRGCPPCYDAGGRPRIRQLV